MARPHQKAVAGKVGDNVALCAAVPSAPAPWLITAHCWWLTFTRGLLRFVPATPGDETALVGAQGPDQPHNVYLLRFCIVSNSYLVIMLRRPREGAAQAQGGVCKRSMAVSRSVCCNITSATYCIFMRAVWSCETESACPFPVKAVGKRFPADGLPPKRLPNAVDDNHILHHPSVPYNTSKSTLCGAVPFPAPTLRQRPSVRKGAILLVRTGGDEVATSARFDIVALLLPWPPRRRCRAESP